MGQNFNFEAAFSFLRFEISFSLQQNPTHQNLKTRFLPGLQFADRSTSEWCKPEELCFVD